MFAWTNPKNAKTYYGLRTPNVPMLVRRAIEARFGRVIHSLTGAIKGQDEYARFLLRLRSYFNGRIPPMYGRGGKQMWQQRLSGYGREFEDWQRRQRERTRQRWEERRRSRELRRIL